MSSSEGTTSDPGPTPPADSKDLARAARIRELRQRRGRTQQAFADELKVSRRAVQEWERHGRISWVNAVQVARVAGISPFVLADGPPEEDPDADPMDTRVARLEARFAALPTNDDLRTAFERISQRVAELAALREGQTEVATALQNLALAVRALQQDVQRLERPATPAPRRQKSASKRSPGAES